MLFGDIIPLLATLSESACCATLPAGKPLANVAVYVKTMQNIDQGKDKQVSNAFGNRSFSKVDGYVTLKCLAGYSFVVTATSSGYHDFGHLGEHMLITPKDGEQVEREVGLVPIRIAVVVTLRELRPIHQTGVMQRDVTGQVSTAAFMRQPSRMVQASRAYAHC